MSGRVSERPSPITSKRKRSSSLDGDAGPGQALPDDLVVRVCRLAGLGGLARFVCPLAARERAPPAIPVSCVTTPGLVEWALAKGCPKDHRLSQVLAAGGHLDALVRARALGCDWNPLTCARAALNGKLDVLKWCRENGCPWDTRAAFSAAAKGRKEVLAWMLDNGWTGPGALEGAAFGGQVGLMSWLVDRGADMTPKACEFAAGGGRLDALKWLRDKGCPWDERLLFAASVKGNIRVLEWVSETVWWGRNGNLVAFSAASAGRADVLEWVYSRDMIWRAGLVGGLEGAALTGKAREIRWLLGKGCRMTSKTAMMAAMGGQVETLQWLRDNGCPMDLAKIFKIASSRDHAGVKAWAENLMMLHQ